MFGFSIEFILLQTFLLKGLSQIEDWNPFDDREGQIYRYVPHKQTPNIRQYMVTDGNVSSNVEYRNESIKVDKFFNVPEKFRYKCQEKFKENSVYVASNMHSGRYCLLMDVLISCLFRTNRSNHYPVVQFMKEPEKRYVASKQNSAVLMGVESNIFSYFFVCSFFENQRIRCESKTARFPVLSDIIPTSSFSYEDPNDNSHWILVVDSIVSTNGQPNRFERHFIENGIKLLATVPQEYEINASTVYSTHKHYIEGYSFVNQFYYKFFFLTETTDFTKKKEILRMLWGNTDEFIGCPKSLCSASVVDTVIKLKDNTTYIFVGKYYWNLTAGLSKENAIFIDADSPFDTHFPYLSSDIDCSFYDIDEDEAYLFKGQYVYSFIQTDVSPPDRTTPNLYGVHISQVFPGLPPDMNAAFYYRPNSTVYFFRDYHYWAYNLRLKKLLTGYPRPVTDFENMPPNIDAIYSDNWGKYYVLSGTFYAEFSEEEFDRGMKLEFKVSNVDLFGCNQTYFDDYYQYKYQMETKFPTVSAKAILDLTNNEGLLDNNEEEAEKGVLQTSTPRTVKRKEQSFLTTFAELIIFGPFFYQLFTDETPHKTKQTIFEAFDE